MDVRKLALLVGSLVIAAVTALFARSLFAADGAPVAQAAAAAAPLPAGPQVLVAKRPLPVGTILSADMVTFQPWPKDLVDSAYFLQETTKLETLPGQVVRVEIAAGQPVPNGALVGPGERGFLAAALGPGMRAISIGVSENSGVSGFIFPGDRVDLMLTQEVTGDGPGLKVTETMAKNVRILAVDQMVDNTKKEAAVRRTVTLEVTPKLAEKIAVAQTIGSMALSLRSLADTRAGLDQAIAEGTVAPGDDATAKSDKAMELALARMPSDSSPTFTTGGEVSRYQRSTPPPSKADGDAGGGGAAPAGGGPAPAERPKGPVVNVARGTDVVSVTIPLGAF